MSRSKRASVLARSVMAWIERHCSTQSSGCPVNVEPLEERRLFITYSVEVGAAMALSAGDGGDPVQLATGTLVLNTTDLQSDGFGSNWGVTRSWTNNPAYNVSQNVGNGWQMNQNPQIVQAAQPSGSLPLLEIVTSGSTADWFENTGSSGSPVFVPYFDSYDQLTYNSGPDTYTLTDKVGDRTTFYGFNGSYGTFSGTFDSYKPASGSMISVVSHDSVGDITEEQRSETSGGVTTIESQLYTYYGSGAANPGELENVTLRRSTNNGSSWTTVRQVQYAFYGSGDPNGNFDDLETATVEDSLGTSLSEYYYRYSLDSDAAPDMLEYEFKAPDFARLDAASLGGYTAFTAPDGDVSPYASLNISYGSGISEVPGAPSSSTASYSSPLYQVTGEVVGGMGSTENSGIGQGTFGFAYGVTSAFSGETFTPDDSASDSQYNTASYYADETLPSGLSDDVYMNYAGEPILDSQFDSTTSTTRNTYNHYDAQARLDETASPLAVANAVYSGGSLSISLSSTIGQIDLYDYYAGTSTAGTTTAGTVNGYLEDEKVQQGTGGTADELESYDYKLQTVGGTSIYYVADDTVYRNVSLNGSGGETTSYQYNYTSGTFSPTVLVTTLPTITTAQNGPNSAATDTQVFDADGNVVWEQNPRGYVSYTAYNIATGAITETIDDLTSANAPSGVPTGWTLSSDSLALITQYTVDPEGRTTEEISPNGNVTYTHYNDSSHITTVYPGWYQNSSGLFTTTGPVQAEQDDWAQGYTDSFTYAYTPGTSSTPNDGGVSTTLLSLTRDISNTSGQVTEEDAYFNLSGVSYSTSSEYLGTLNTNYYATLYTYDAGSNPDRVQSPTGTITRTVYDQFNEPISTWIGSIHGTGGGGPTVDDAVSGAWSPGNAGGMVEVSASGYDLDGNNTENVQYPSNGSGGRATVMYYDFQDRLIAEMTGAVESWGSTDTASADTSDNDTFVTYYTLDNLGEVTEADTYNANGAASVNFSTGSILGPASGSPMILTAASSAAYDNQGNVFSSSVISVNPSNHSEGTTDTTNNYYDADGNLIATISPTGSATKYAWNGADWNTFIYVTDGGQLNNASNVSIGSSNAYSSATSISHDIVLSQTQSVYDNDGNVIETISRDRFGTDGTSNGSTGGLGTPTSGVYARVSYTASYYDAADRDIADVNVGTDGGSSWTRPAYTSIARSGTELVTSYVYDSAGNLAFVTDPNGVSTATGYDALGRVTMTVANWTAVMGPVNTSTLGTLSDFSNQTTEYTYDGDDHVLSMTAVMPGGETSQVTHYVYGVTTGVGSLIDDNDLLYQVQYPDPHTGSNYNASGYTYNQSEGYTYNATGDKLTYTDRDGNVHDYTYDLLDRLVSDQVVTLGAGVAAGGTLGYAYTDAGQLYTATTISEDYEYDYSYIENQVLYTYDGLGQVQSEAQDTYSNVSGGSPVVSYTYDAANGDRPTSITYPDSRVVNYNYSSGLDSITSRISSVRDASGNNLQSYSYLGLDTPVTFTDGNGVSLSYLGTVGSTSGDAGDQYSGLDRFGRVIDQQWNNSSGTIDEYQYGYDADSNVLYKKNTVLTTKSELYTYDSLDRLTNYSTGTLNSGDTAMTTTTSTEGWNLDALGNWHNSSNGSTVTNRNTSGQNQVTSVGSASLSYDANGNLSVDQSGHHYYYDAWNNLVEITGSGLNVYYQYDALGRRDQEFMDVGGGGGSASFYYDTSGQVIQETGNLNHGGSASSNIEYVWSPFYVDQMIERDTYSGGTDTRLYPTYDADYNTTGLTNSSGGVVERYTYDPYGNVTYLNASGGVISASAYAWIYLDQDMRVDVATGTVYYINRVYVLVLDRFAQEDPAGDVNGPNLYQLEESNPVGSDDPSGEDVQLPANIQWQLQHQPPAAGTGALGFHPVMGVPGPEPDFDSLFGKKKKPAAAPPDLTRMRDIPPGGFSPLIYGPGLGDTPSMPPLRVPLPQAPPTPPPTDPSQLVPDILKQLAGGGDDGDGGGDGGDDDTTPPDPTPSDDDDGNGSVNKGENTDPPPQDTAPQERTPEENRQARNKYKNNKPAARQAYTERTGKPWPQTDGQNWPGHHDPSLKSGGDPMNVVPQDPNGVDPHSIVGPDGLTDYQRWGAQGAAARKANQSK